MPNVYNNESIIDYDTYHLLPVGVTDPMGMQVKADNDYRLLAPWKMTDPNENVIKVAFNALGLVTKMILCRKDTGTEGDTLAVRCFANHGACPANNLWANAQRRSWIKEILDLKHLT